MGNFFAGKDIENRTWALPKLLIGQRIAIHAGKRFDMESAEYLRKLGFDCLLSPADHPEGIVGTVIYRSAVQESPSVWSEGPVGNMISDMQRLDIMLACRGQQGLWPVPQELMESL